MNMRNKIKRSNLAINAAAIVASTSIAFYSFAAPDYDRIKKDINVMVGVVKSSFTQNESCKKCRIKISGHYLADQGVVFNVEPSSHAFYNYDYAPEVQVITDGIAAIPPMVTEILEDVQIQLDGDTAWEWHSDGDWGDWSHANREVREALREVRNEMRELARELREVEIEAIHAEDEELETLREREQKIERRIQEAENREDEIREKQNNYTEERQRAREQQRAKRAEEQRQRFEDMENVVLNTFCDYSRTMRNIPTNEKISIVMKRSDEGSNIYVFNVDDLEDCDSRKGNVRSHALSYAF